MKTTVFTNAFLAVFLVSVMIGGDVHAFGSGSGGGLVKYYSYS